MDLGDKVCLVDLGDAVMSWHWEPHFSWNPGLSWGVCCPLHTPFDQCKPSNPK